MFPILAECLARRRAARDAQRQARRRQVHYIHLHLEDLEERVVPDADVFATIQNGVLVPSVGAYTNVGLWTDLSLPGGPGPAPNLPEGGDTATIPIGAVCTLDSTEEQTIAGLAVQGSLTIRSLLTVQTTTLSGSGSTTVAAGGLLDVATPDVSGETSTLDTVTLTTIGGGAAVNLSIDPSAEVEINLSATISGMTTVTGLLDAKNIDAFNGAGVVLDGPGTVGGTGQLEAGINASITFDPASSWVIGPGNPVGSALKEGNFFVDGPLTVSTDLDPDGDIILNDDGGVTTSGSITGSGSLDEWNKFTWNGGLLALAGNVTIEPQAEWKLAGPDPKALACDVTNINMSTELGGTGNLTIATGNTFLNAFGTVAVSLPLIAGAGTFANAAGATVQIDAPAPTGVTIGSVLDNEGTIDCETGAGPLVLDDINGSSSILNGSLALNNDSLVIDSTYTTNTSFVEEWSPNDLTTLAGPGTLIVASGSSADFDHMVIMGGGIVTGAGDFSIGADGLHTGNYLTWESGTMSGTGTTTIGPYATLSIPGDATGDTLDSRTIENHGLVSWAGALTIADSSGNGGPTFHNEKDGTFDVESSGGSAPIPTFTNDGMLEVASGGLMMVDTFTQSSTGTLQSDIAADSDFGMLSVTGTATLDGTLQANLEDGYQPPSGTKFAVMTFGSSSGQFADVKPDGWSAEYDPTSISLVSS
jgi:hypothetical protein